MIFDRINNEVVDTPFHAGRLVHIWLTYASPMIVEGINKLAALIELFSVNDI